MLLSIKLRNAVNRELKQAGLDFQASYQLKNTYVNGQRRGCSGYITNVNTGICVFVDTEESVLSSLSGKCLYRYAKDENGIPFRNPGGKGRNRWAAEKELAQCVVSLLKGES